MLWIIEILAVIAGVWFFSRKARKNSHVLNSPTASFWKRAFGSQK